MRNSVDKSRISAQKVITISADYAGGVINPEGELDGILSMNDVVLRAKAPDAAAGDSIGYGDVMKTYQAICRHPVPAAAATSSASA